MPWSLKRFQQAYCLHFITFSCQHQDPLLSTPQSRDVFLKILERARKWYDFFVTGYVVMPEHIHLLISEPQRKKLSIAIQMLKQNTAHQIRPVEAYPYGSRATTTSMSGVKRSGWRNYVICIAIRFIEDCYNARRIGNGAASTTTRPGSRVRSKSSRSGLRGKGRGRGSFL